MNDDYIDSMRKMLAKRIAEVEHQEFGHRIIYDPLTGWSKNICGLKEDPADIDPITGYLIR